MIVSPKRIFESFGKLTLFKRQKAAERTEIGVTDADQIVTPADELEAAYLQIGELADELAKVSADLVAEKARSDFESVKARILEPYVNKVFNFVAAYCGTVAVFLFLAALGRPGFKLPESIQAIIAGSTAVSVIGLIGLVITGLFGAKTKN